VVPDALKADGRAVDTAAAYENERKVQEGVVHAGGELVGFTF
jgi:diketogulonate reductase-like aldo/keto reductase